MGTSLLPLAVLSTLLISQVASLCNNETHFDCKVGSTRRCIPLEWQCDNVPDCENASDEVGCSYLHNCDYGMMMCRGGACISRAFKCDGESDCPGGHDEHGCAGMDTSHLRPVILGHSEESEEAPEHFRVSEPLSLVWRDEKCESPKYKCASGSRCLIPSAVCDGFVDCPEGDDEKNCTSKIHCTDEEMVCANGLQCIPKSWMCDGERDCPDGSDESFCESTSENSLEMVGIQFNHVLCSPDDYRCSGVTGACISLNKTCDGVRDCPLGDDENDRCKECHSLGCHYKCHITEHGGRCYCQDGSKLDIDGRSCLEVNECDTHEGRQCQHFCDDRHNTYECRCAPGYSLGRDGHACHVDKNHEGMLFVSLGSEVRSMPLFNAANSEGAYAVAQTIGSNGLARNVAFMHRTNALYMALQDHDGELALSLNGQMHILRQNMIGLAQIAADWIGGNIYITQKYPAAQPGISVCTVDGFFCKRIIDGNVQVEGDVSKRQNYRGLALNPQHGTMAWIEAYGGKYKIMAANMDGSNIKVVEDSKLDEPNGLTWDPIRNELYFGDIGTEMIEKIDMKTMERHMVLTHGVYHPFDLVFFDGLLFWSDWIVQELKMAELSWHHQSSHVVHTFNRLPYGVSINHTTYQPRPDRDPCDAVKNTCSWICVVIPDMKGQLHPSCVCPENYKAENNTCIPEKRIHTSQDSHFGVTLMEEMCSRDKACLNGGSCNRLIHGDRVVRVTCNCPAPFWGDRCEGVDPNASAMTDSASSGSSHIFGYLFALLLLIAIFAILYKQSSAVNDFTKATMYRIARIETPQLQPWLRSHFEALHAKIPTGTSTRVSHSQVDNPLYDDTDDASVPASSSSSSQQSGYQNPMFGDSSAPSESNTNFKVSYANKFVH